MWGEVIFGTTLIVIGICCGYYGYNEYGVEEYRMAAEIMVLSGVLILVMTLIMALLYRRARRKSGNLLDDTPIRFYAPPIATILLLLVVAVLWYTCRDLVTAVDGMQEFVESKEFHDFVVEAIKSRF